jgi:hypothetical protein
MMARIGVVHRSDERGSGIGIRDRRGVRMEAAPADLFAKIRAGGEGLERFHESSGKEDGPLSQHSAGAAETAAGAAGTSSHGNEAGAQAHKPWIGQGKLCRSTRKRA